MRVILICDEAPELSARSLTEFIFDLTMLYDKLVIFSQNASDPILYSRKFYRRWRRLERGLELKIARLSKESPLQIELIIGAAAGLIGAAKLFVEMLRLLAELPLEIEKRRLDVIERKITLLERIGALKQANPEIGSIVERDLQRLLGNEIKIRHVEEKPN